MSFLILNNVNFNQILLVPHPVQLPQKLIAFIQAIARP